MNEFNISGAWLSRYYYQSGEATEMTSREHSVVFERENDELVGRSMPQQDGSELTLHLRYNAADRILTGLWQVKTSQETTYKGAIFYGALQLILNETNTVARGKWVGFNSSRTKVKAGEWRIEKKQSK